MPHTRTWTLLAALDGFRDACSADMPPSTLFAADLDAIPTDEWLAFVNATLADVGGWHNRLSHAEAELVRHGLNHLRRGDGPLSDRLGRCVSASGPYFVSGVGWRFWAAAARSLDPARLPLWCPEVLAGCDRFAAAGDRRGDDLAGSFAAVCGVYNGMLRARPTLTADHLDRFFRAVSRGVGREPGTGEPDLCGRDRRIRHELRGVRSVLPLRVRLHNETQQTPPDPASHAALDDAVVSGLSQPDRDRLLASLALALRDRYRVHPSEVGDLLARFAQTAIPAPGRFGGFSCDTFQFLGELADNNTAAWMATARDRYRYAVRLPLVELCQAVAERYITPVLGSEYRWNLETEARPGKALSSVCKNDFGQSGPYQTVLWTTFYLRPGSKKAAAQLFIRLAADGLSFGFHLSRTARADGRRFRANVQAHGPLLFEALQATGGTGLRFAGGADAPGVVLGSVAGLREWAVNKDLLAGVWLGHDEAVHRTEELVGAVLLAFDRLLPLFAAAVMDDPTPVLAKRAGRPVGGGFDRTAFREATLLAEPWLDRALDLLQTKRQLVLQGVPGTGKTHVARCLARHLTGDRPELLSIVQFHPAYSYEEFVEGIRPKGEGASVSYPVEPGVLLRVAERAAKHPADPHVLLIDEVNRGNLPRVFGELLYLLEYRDQEVTLPYSKAPFRLPPNLFLIATLNPADRSVTPLDQATRRRFAFLDMTPDPAVLSRWLARHSPADPDADFGGQMVKWFERINRHLTRDFGPDRQVGHAYWLRDGLTREIVGRIWDHEVRPALADLFAGSPDRLDRLAPPVAGAAPEKPPRRPARVRP